jgi:hypothetical protein
LLHFSAAWDYPSLNPRMKRQMMTLRAASVCKRKKGFSAGLPPSFAGLCANKHKPSIGSGIRRNYCHSKKVGVGPSALARCIRHHNARKATIAQLRKR